MLTVAVPKRNKLPNIIVLTPKDGEEGECKRRAVRLYDLDGNMIEVGEVSWQRV